VICFKALEAFKAAAMAAYVSDGEGEGDGDAIDGELLGGGSSRTSTTKMVMERTVLILLPDGCVAPSEMATSRAGL